jgi:hypothetical protein
MKVYLEIGGIVHAFLASALHEGVYHAKSLGMYTHDLSGYKISYI